MDFCQGPQNKRFAPTPVGIAWRWLFVSNYKYFHEVLITTQTTLKCHFKAHGKKV
jgi:hypothetical protein